MSHVTTQSNPVKNVTIATGPTRALTSQIVETRPKLRSALLDHSEHDAAKNVHVLCMRRTATTLL